MPLPWKKKSGAGGGGGGSRISRLVSDLQAPPKRGGSLVVETGFPTSLIDLFVKNRDRIKKSSKKHKPKKQHQEQQHRHVGILEAPSASPADDSEVLRRTTAAEATPVAEEVHCASPERSHVSEEEGDEKEVPLPRSNSLIVEPFKDLPNRIHGCSSSLLKMALVVILGLLALFAKWVVIGTTIAAFILFFIEFMGGAAVISSFKPCAAAGARFEGLIRTSGSIRSSEPKLRRDSSSNSDSTGTSSSGSERGSGEIEGWEPNLATAANAPVEDSLISEAETEAVIAEEIENQEQEHRGRRSKSRMRIIKRIVPKKIRNHKKSERDGVRS